MKTQLTTAEIRDLTGYRTPSRQLQILHARGFTRAYRVLGMVFKTGKAKPIEGVNLAT